MKRSWGMAVLVLGLAAPAAGAGRVDSGDCLGCHREREPALVAAWKESGHGGLACPVCHGTGHDGGMAARARGVEACSGCHEQERGSFLLSKHGVIVRMEGARLDLKQPLKEGNQRAPTCAYCHLHDGNHGGWGARESASRAEARAAPCRDCHAPRLVETWFTSGDAMVEIGRMKLREAQAVAARIPAAEVAARQATRTLEEGMARHLHNVLLGVGHQSPDDQWWHGHPALDGDLLRIKSILSELLLRAEGGER